jgi:hypothetical protein
VDDLVHPALTDLLNRLPVSTELDTSLDTNRGIYRIA